MAPNAAENGPTGHPPLLLRQKIAYGVGQAAEGFKNNSFETFLFFYYNQVLGLSGSLSGLAVFIALVFDAVTDPMAGSLSDSWRSRLGRRHPFMYVSALPLAVTFYLLFIPPEGLGQAGLFAWLTVFAILVRGSMTLYHVPHLALGAELSSDYHERTGIVGYRTVFGIGGAFSVTVLGFFYFFRPTAEFAQGQLNPAAYPVFAAFFALAMLATIWYSAVGTHARIPTLTLPSDQIEPFSARRIMGEVAEVLRNGSFRNLFIGVVIFFVMRGVQFTLGLHLNTYFWELETWLIGVVGVVIVSGILIGVPFWARVSRTIDKKPTFLAGMVIFTVFAVTPPVLKIIGLWPAHENLVAYVAAIGGMGFIAAFGGAAALVAAGSMMADLTDQHELATGRRQEGIFFSVLSFAGKSSSGLGHQIAGVGIDLIGFPIGAVPGAVAQPIVDNLGILYGPGLLPLAAISMIFLVRYDLSRDRLMEIQSELAQRRQSGAAAAARPGTASA